MKKHYIPVLKAIFLLVFFWNIGVDFAVAREESFHLNQHLAVPMQGTKPIHYTPRAVPTAPRSEQRSGATYAVQPMHTTTRAVSSHAGGASQSGASQAVAASGVHVAHSAVPVAIKDYAKPQSTQTAAPTLAEDELALADGLIMKAPGGGGGIGDGNSDKENTSAPTPLGEGTWILLLLAAVYVGSISRKRFVA